MVGRVLPSVLHIRDDHSRDDDANDDGDEQEDHHLLSVFVLIGSGFLEFCCSLLHIPLDTLNIPLD